MRLHRALPLLALLAGVALVAAPVAAAASSNTAITTNKNANAVDAPTWSETVASILHENCVSCHRPGQIAPMALRTYEEARPWARSIARQVEAGEMPPWHAAGGIATFANDRSLEPSEVDALVRWAKSGAPAGDLSTAPAPPEFPDTKWRLGEPDYVVTLEQVSVPAGGPDQFHNLVGKVALDEDQWVTAVEILPGNAKVVHHVIAFAVKGFDVDPQEGWLGAWAAGTQPMVFPEGTGRLLESGSNLIADMHYHPAETAETDVTRIGLHFADTAPAKELTNVWVMNTSFEIPAGDQNHEVRAKRKFWQDGRIMAFAPHMHYRGKDFSYTAHYPDGTSELLFSVDDYDFSWQTNYVLAEPIDIPAGTVVECVAHYDNSTANPDNPDPTKNVTFGDESYDEMMIGFLDFIVGEGIRPLTPHQVRTRQISTLAEEHPGQVYAVSAKEADQRSEPDSFAPFHLPREGDGLFYVIWGDQGLQASKVHSLQWNGDDFTGKLESPWGDFEIDGSVEGDRVEATMHLPDNELTWDGERVES